MKRFLECFIIIKYQYTVDKNKKKYVDIVKSTYSKRTFDFYGE